tara:strand:+ start:423 stop:1610 length:1188 start_codon:yes stop_codon:yes gene_type:complete
MKLLLENWRKYLAESEKAESYGHLYLFEDDNVTKTSFYDALTTLSESNDDHAAFLENWEKSVEYQLNELQEISDPTLSDPALEISAQAYVTLGRMKDKALKPVFNTVAKLNDYAEKNPKTAKAIKYATGGLLAGLAIVGIYGVLNSGGDASDVMELAQSLQPEDPGLAKEVAECAQDFTPQKVAEFVKEQTNTIEQVADTLSTADNAATDQVAQAADAVAGEVGGWENELEDMFNEPRGGDADPSWAERDAQDLASQATDAGGGGGDFSQTIEDIKNATTEDELWDSLGRGETDQDRALKKLARQIEAGEFDGENRKALRQLIKAMPKGDGKNQIKAFIRARKAAKAIKTILNVTPAGAFMNIVTDLAGGGDNLQQAADMAFNAGRGTKLGKSLE